MACSAIERRALWMAEDAARELPNLPLEDALQLVRLFGERGSPKYEKATLRWPGIPVFSPHDLRHRRISPLHHQGESWAEIGAKVGQRNISTTADTYRHVLMDYRELDRAKLLGRVAVAAPTKHLARLAS